MMNISETECGPMVVIEGVEILFQEGTVDLMGIARLIWKQETDVAVEYFEKLLESAPNRNNYIMYRWITSKPSRFSSFESAEDIIRQVATNSSLGLKLNDFFKSDEWAQILSLKKQVALFVRLQILRKNLLAAAQAAKEIEAAAYCAVVPDHSNLLLLAISHEQNT
jgi:hypothetical protein